MSDETEFTRSYSPPGGARMRRLSFTYTDRDVQDFIQLHGMGIEVGIVEAVTSEIHREFVILVERARKRLERLRRYQRKCRKRRLSNRKREARR